MCFVADLDCGDPLSSADKTGVGRSAIGVPFGGGERYDRVLEYQVIWKHKFGKVVHLSFSDPGAARNTAAIISNIPTVELVYFLALVEQDWYYHGAVDGLYRIAGMNYDRVNEKRITHWRVSWLKNKEPHVLCRPKALFITVPTQILSQ